VALVCTVSGRRPKTFSKLDNYGYGSWSLVIVEQHESGVIPIRSQPSAPAIVSTSLDHSKALAPHKHVLSKLILPTEVVAVCLPPINKRGITFAFFERKSCINIFEPPLHQLESR